MQTVTLSPKFQIVIPSDICKQSDIHAGDELQVIPYNGRIELVPVRPMPSMRGFLAGIDTTVPRDGDRV